MSDWFVAISPKGPLTSTNSSTVYFRLQDLKLSPRPSKRGTAWSTVYLTANNRGNKKIKGCGKEAKMLKWFKEVALYLGQKRTQAHKTGEWMRRTRQVLL